MAINQAHIAFVHFLLLSIGLVAVLGFTQEPKVSMVDFQMESILKVETDSIRYEVWIVTGQNNQPDHYYAEIFTPVCYSRTCLPVFINFKWDLLGNYQKYELPEEKVLTKYDHLEFDKKEYEKLQEILSNENSILKNYKADQLVASTESINPTGVDAVTGATIKSIQNEVISGAVYSCYTLWHIAHGDISEKLKHHTENDLKSDDLLIQFLQSSNYHYQYYALNRISATDTKAYLKEIIHLISDGSSYVPFFAIEKLPEEAWRSPIHQGTLINLLAKVDFKMQNELLNKLKGIQLSKSAMQSLSNMLQKLSGQQILKALEIITYNQTSLSHTSMLTISSMLAHPDSEIGKNVYRLLKSNSKENKDIEKILTQYKNQKP